MNRGSMIAINLSINKDGYDIFQFSTKYYLMLR